MRIDEFLKRYPNTEYVDAAFVDMSGGLRGKRLPVNEAKKISDGAVMLPYSVHLLTATGETADAGGLGISDGDPDGIARPVPETLVPVSWTPAPGAQVLMELLDENGDNYAHDPRQVLKRSVESLEAHGVRPVVAFELEFYLFEPACDADGAPQLAQSIDQSAHDQRIDVYAFEPLDANYEFFDAVRRAAIEQGIEASVATSEYAAGQFEINLHHSPDVMRMADQCVMFKRLVKGVAMAHGMRASFMAKPLIDSSGSGMHLHLSLIDAAGSNVFSVTEEPIDCDPLRHAVGGLLDSMAEGVAIFAPNLNAYRRFQPGSYAPMQPSWGVNHRAVACRIPAGDRGSRRIEHRVAAADASPHLVLAAILAGVENGLRHELEPGAPIGVDNVDAVPSGPLFPRDLDQALDTLLSSAKFNRGISAEYIQLYAETKRTEYRDFFAKPFRREFQWYL